MKFLVGNNKKAILTSGAKKPIDIDPMILSVKKIFIFYEFAMAELIRLAKMVGVMHQVEHAYSVWSIW